MKQNTTFNIYIMSTMRSHLTTKLSANLFEYYTYVVQEREEKAYRDAGIENILTIPDGAVNDFMTTFYWIVENTPEDVVCIVDDDIKFMQYRIDTTSPIEDKEACTAEAERIGQLLVDLDLGLAYDNPHYAPYAYDKEFSFKGMPGHIRWVNKSAFKAKLNVDDPATSDIDMAMQEMLINRIILLPKYFVSNAYMDKLEGDTLNRSAHIEFTYALKNKWGRYYDYDYRKNKATINILR